MSSSIPTQQDLWFLPLGGTGEIGMNLNLYGHNGQWLMVDCGVTFNEPLQAGDITTCEMVSADPDFIAQQRQRLAGIVITHAHEDHIGAVPFLWERFKAPVYTTPFTATILRRKLAQAGILDDVTIHEVPLDGEAQIGEFHVTWLTLTHSIPEPCALFIRTPAGNVFHTGDWKIDFSPVVGDRFNKQLAQPWQRFPVHAMVCDSTNALRVGHSGSEEECYHGLLETIKGQTGRVVVGCFSSNIARLVSIARIAKETGRYCALMGRSLQNMVSAARISGYWPEDVDIIDSRHIGYLPPSDVLAVATGSQGEPRAMLTRLALDNCYDLSLQEGDAVVFSAMIIPGNEKDITRLVERFQARKIRTIQTHDTDAVIHVSGHPYQDELRQMYEWFKPNLAIPTHGEAEHMKANGQIAKSAGVARVLTGKNGDLFQIAPQAGLRRQIVKARRIALER